ncbi:hypothetical protein [Ureibacillus thermosphaericus]|uniref:hypothetical protein n=1 Tax=Ureibacillus thermosphaericus TaxID=51173 RepID=UPI000BBC6A91|nr:hypothetical protein [Ureibacillus thermosphaericus]
MKEKKIDIINKYTREVQDIKNKLKDLEKGRIYELSNAKMDGYLATNIIQLRNMIRELISKIEYGEDSINDQLSQLFNINKNSQSLGLED